MIEILLGIAIISILSLHFTIWRVVGHDPITPVIEKVKSITRKRYKVYHPERDPVRIAKGKVDNNFDL